MKNREEPFTRWLPVELTDEEMLGKAKEMSKLCEDRTFVEREKAIQTKDFAEKIKNISGEISKLVTIVSSGFESREVECTRVFDYKNKEVRALRTDTDEIIEKRPLRVDESQTEIPLITNGVETIEENF